MQENALVPHKTLLTWLASHRLLTPGVRKSRKEGRNVTVDMKRGLRNSILLPSLTYGSENWTRNGVQQSAVRAVEISYLRGACGVGRWDGLSNKSVHKRCGVRGYGSGLGCSVMEWLKRSTLR